MNDVKINLSSVSLSYSLSPIEGTEVYSDEAAVENDIPLSRSFLDISSNTPNHFLARSQTDYGANCTDTSSFWCHDPQSSQTVHRNNDDVDFSHHFFRKDLDTCEKEYDVMSSLSLSGGVPSERHPEQSANKCNQGDDGNALQDEKWNEDQFSNTRLNATTETTVFSNKKIQPLRTTSKLTDRPLDPAISSSSQQCLDVSSSVHHSPKSASDEPMSQLQMDPEFWQTFSSTMEEQKKIIWKKVSLNTAL